MRLDLMENSLNGMTIYCRLVFVKIAMKGSTAPFQYHWTDKRNEVFI